MHAEEGKHNWLLERGGSWTPENCYNISEKGDFLTEIAVAIFVNVPSILIVLYLSPKPAFDEIGCRVVLVFIPAIAQPRVWSFMLFPLLSHVFLAVATMLCPSLVYD